MTRHSYWRTNYYRRPGSTTAGSTILRARRSEARPDNLRAGEQSSTGVLAGGMAASELISASVLAPSTGFCNSVSTLRPTRLTQTQSRSHLGMLGGHRCWLEASAFSGNTRLFLERQGVSIRLSASNRGDAGNTDDEGVIRDMERYLEDLSLEYDSVWDTKPAWCQPWSIILTGAVAITGSWALFKAPFVTGALSALILGWWWIFLYSYPLAYTEMIEERRRKIRSGDEDTFGREKVNGVSR